MSDWRTMQPGRERQAARAKHYQKLIPPDAPIERVTVNGRTGVRGPSRIVHFYDDPAQEQIAARLARTHAKAFPTGLLTTEIRDGQLIVSCRTKPDKLVIPRELPPRFLEIAIDHLREAEQRPTVTTRLIGYINNMPSKQELKQQLENSFTAQERERKTECTTPIVKCP